MNTPLDNYLINHLNISACHDHVTIVLLDDIFCEHNKIFLQYYITKTNKYFFMFSDTVSHYIYTHDIYTDIIKLFDVRIMSGFIPKYNTNNILEKIQNFKDDFQYRILFLNMFKDYLWNNFTLKSTDKFIIDIMESEGNVLSGKDIFYEEDFGG